MAKLSKLSLNAVLVAASLFVAGASGSKATVWTVVAIDPKDDGRAESSVDAAQLSFRYEPASGMLWFRLSLYRAPNVAKIDVNIAIDTGDTSRQKTQWRDASRQFAFDRLVTATVTKAGSEQQGDVHVRTEDRAILIGVKREGLTDKTSVKVIAAVSSNGQQPDDMPNTNAATVDWGAPRPARGLREIDATRNNLAFDGHQKLLGERSAPQISRSGGGRAALILIPGVYSSSDVFDGFMSRNNARYTFHKITPAGLGGTAPRAMPPSSVSYGALTWTRQLAADIRHLSERERLDKPIIVTHGFPGSLAAEELAINHPSAIGGIVEIASMAVQPFPSWRGSGREALPEERITIVDEGWAQQWFKYVTPETWESNNYPAEMFTNDAGRAERVRQEIEAVQLPVKIRYLIEFMASDHRPAFDGISVPVLMLQPGFSQTLLSNPTFGWFKSFFQDWWRPYPANPLVTMKTIPEARALLLDDQPAQADEAIAALVATARDMKLSR
jgi:pimeloyl-ACP methyl ester carboxylesterase